MDGSCKGGVRRRKRRRERRRRRACSLTFGFFDPVPVHLGPLEAILVGDIRRFEHGHDPVEQSMNHLEAAGLAAPGRGKVSLVATLAFERKVFEGDVRHLEDLDRHAVMLVLSDRLEEARKERRPHDLILRRLRVGQLDGRRAVVFAVQPGKVLVVRA